jgi:hypothetical protein
LKILKKEKSQPRKMKPGKKKPRKLAEKGTKTIKNRVWCFGSRVHMLLLFEIYFQRI